MSTLCKCGMSSVGKISDIVCYLFLLQTGYRNRLRNTRGTFHRTNKHSIRVLDIQNANNSDLDQIELVEMIIQMMPLLVGIAIPQR